MSRLSTRRRPHISSSKKSPRRIRNREINVNYMEKIYAIFGQRSSLEEKEKSRPGHGDQAFGGFSGSLRCH